MKRLVIALLVVVAAGCGGSSGSTHYITISSLTFSPNPVTAGDDVRMCLYVDETSARDLIKWLKLETSEGKTVEVPVVNPEAIDVPGWVCVDTETTTAKTITVTLWLEMTDRTQSNKISSELTITEG